MENQEKNDQSGDRLQEFKGKNLEEAIGHAEHILKIPRSELNYEIVTEKTKLFGLSKEIVIRAWAKIEAEENAVSNFLEKLLPVFPLEISYQIKKKNGFVFVIFDGEDKQLLLWKDGALLLALQHVLNKISSQKVQVDCEFFRKRKEKRLRDYAQQVARQVYETGRNEILDLMNPYERRIVHIAVNQVPGITSESLGDGFLKRVKIFPVGKTGKS
ncbi:MAG: Jag N-terminal domain-containing protein [Candidatus Aminicenantes bacterium]|jgi:spoIIIJ-associated protein|nr:Jag N-terminal domain-containing protein [Candidatus Aminicenantes bacterium]